MFDWLIPGLLLVTGATGLVYEVVAGRLLSLHLGSSGSSQAITLATFLGGMALGAVLAERVLRRRLPSVRAPLLGYAVLEAFIGLWALALASLLAIGLFNVPFPAIVAVAALVGYVWGRWWPRWVGATRSRRWAGFFPRPRC